MSLYKFTDINTTHTDNYLAPDGVIWDGHSLEEEIDNLTFLDASGREAFTRDVTSIERTGDGNIFRRSRITSRVITVNWWLNAADADEFAESLRILKATLQGEERKFTFNDEPNYYMVGTVTDFQLDTDGTYKPRGHFDITLSDPFKYAFPKTIDSANDTVIPDQELIYPSRVDDIVTDSINGGSLIEFEHYRDGVLQHWVTFDNPQTGVQRVDFINKVVYSNNINWNTHLLFTSNFSSWGLLQNDEVKVWLTDSTGRHEIHYVMEYEVRYL